MARTIMVVEDEPDIRELVATSLEIEGFEVVTAADGDDALDQLESHPEVELLFTDIVMPGRLHGFDLARVARERRPSLKLLYTSGYALTAALEATMPVEEAELVRKPYRIDTLLGAIRSALGADR